ncbi:MAG: hypothetical protein IJ760_01395 [Bacteroidales bacterium]|nr:hypothetical protein [Bacteroidales bacterium]
MNKPRTFFHVLLVLSIVLGCLNAVAYISIGMMLPALEQVLADNPTLVPDEFAIMTERLFEAPQGFFVASALLYALEVVGCFVMWRERWTGFHCYTLARLLLLLLPAIFLGWGFVGLGDVMFAVLFILVYLGLMSRMTAGEPGGGNLQE